MSAKSSKKPSQTDWDRLANLADDEIDYSEIPPLGADFFENATWRMPERSFEGGASKGLSKDTVTLRLDHDVVAWFRAQGREYQQRINSALRAYKEAHEKA